MIAPEVEKYIRKRVRTEPIYNEKIWLPSALSAGTQVCTIPVNQEQNIVGVLIQDIVIDLFGGGGFVILNDAKSPNGVPMMVFNNTVARTVFLSNFNYFTMGEDFNLFLSTATSLLNLSYITITYTSDVNQ